jgi:hypothetical protein
LFLFVIKWWRLFTVVGNFHAHFNKR